MKTTRCIALVAVAVAALQISTSAQAVPTARQILESAKKAQASVKTMQARQTVTDTGMGVKGTMNTAFQSPNKAYIETRIGSASRPTMIIVSDGKKVWQYDGRSNQYIIQPVPKNLAENMPFGIQGDIKKIAKIATYGGTETIRGISTHLLRYNINGVKTKVWIGAKDSQVYRIVMDTTEMQKRRMAEIAKRTKMAMPKMKGPAITTVNVTSLQINKPVPASKFVFHAPKGAKEAKMPMMGGPGAPGRAGKPNR